MASNIAMGNISLWVMLMIVITFLNYHLFIERLQAGYDMVMGNRFAGGITKGAMPWFIAMSAIRSCRPWGVFYLRIILETSIVV